MPKARARKCGWSRRMRRPRSGRGRSPPSPTIIVEPFGDIWLRDTGPIVLGSGKDRRAQGFGFNGWGGKYELAGDEDINRRLARAAGLDFALADWILEGGAIDGDGSGCVLTTEQCLLNPNRNALTRDEVEQRLLADLGFERVVWLGEGLANDHTDGHVDNLARFVAPGRVAIPKPTADDPNQAIYRDAALRLRAAGLDIVSIPSPGPVVRDGDDHPGKLHELLHRQCRGGGAAIWRGQRPGRGRRRRGPVPGPRCNRPSRRPHPHRRWKLPLHFSQQVPE